MASLSILAPYPLFYDRDGQPLDNGNVYIGVANLDSETNPIPVYYDEALTIQASQPLKTSGGYIYRNGTPTRIHVNGEYSILVTDKNNTLVYYSPVSIGPVQIGVFYPVTSAEYAAGVTPVNFSYTEGDNRRYGSWVDFVAVMSEGVEGHLWSDMTTDAMATATSDITLVVHGWISITATAAIVNILRTQGRCSITASGELLMDGDNLTTGACLHYESYFPNLQNVRWLDSAIGGAGGTTSYDGAAYGAAGDATWINVVAENCADLGFAIRGQLDKSITAATSANPIEMTVTGHGFPNGAVLDFNEFTGDWFYLDGRRYPITVTGPNTFTIPVDGSGFAAYTSGGTCAYRTSCVDLINCKTKGTTGDGDFAGSGVGFLYHLAGLKSLSMKGGVYEGDTTARCTAGYRCSHVEIVGSWHDYVSRGPTIGFNTHLFTVVGAAASNMSGNGISADTTDGVGATVGIGAVTGNVAAYAARGVRATSSNIVISGNYAHECTEQFSGHIVAAGEADTVLMDGNLVHSTIWPANNYTAFGYVENSGGFFGVNATNSDWSASVVGDDVTMLGSTGTIREVTANTDLYPTDRVLLVDTTAGNVTISLFDSGSSHFTGFDFTIVPVAGSGVIYLNLINGSTSGTINGVGTTQSILVSEPQRRQPVRCICVDGLTGKWITTVPGLNYVTSGTVSWNPASLANNGTPLTQTISAPGATTADFVELSFTQDLLGCVLFGKVTAPNTVTAYLVNATGSTQDVGSGSLRALVWRRAA